MIEVKNMYAKGLKRAIDFFLSLVALSILSPILIILIVVGAVAMKGNPFFTQMRPGKIDKRTGKEKIFRLIKFRTMSNAKDKDGNLLVGCRTLKYGCHNNMAVLPKNKLLVMQGVDDMLIVDTDDVLLVCKKGNERDIRKFLNEAKMKLGENIG